jgi:hypothetical protein
VKTFGRWKFLKFVRKLNSPHRFAKVKCTCGKVRTVRFDTLRDGVSKSCGCLAAENVGKRNFRHGDASRTAISPEWIMWRSMRARCANPSHKSFKDYGARGITVCKRWMKFKNFLADMGRRPPGLTLERKNNERGYCKSNCKWATRSEQAINRRMTPARLAHCRRALKRARKQKEKNKNAKHSIL